MLPAFSATLQFAPASHSALVTFNAYAAEGLDSDWLIADLDTVREDVAFLRPAAGPTIVVRRADLAEKGLLVTPYPFPQF